MDPNRLGALALAHGLIEEAELERCLAVQEKTSPPRYLGQVLVDEGVLKPSALQHLLTAQHRVQEAPEFSSKEIADRLAAAPLEDYLRVQAELGAQELHLAVGQRPLMRRNGRLRALSPAPLSVEECRRLLLSFLDERRFEQFVAQHSLDTVHTLPKAGRYRVHLFMQSRGPAGVFCRLPDALPSADALDLPAIVQEVPRLANGLVLVTGPGASGKTLTLAMLVDLINQSRPRHVVTLEQPVEFLHESRKGLISQREVGTHVTGWREALKTALREDPDVIVVADLDGAERIATALTAAETGQLVIGSLRTPNAQATLMRIVEAYAGARRQMVRAMLAALLRFSLSQQLVPSLDGERLHLAVEVLRNTPAVATMIREGRLHQLPDAIQTGRDLGMISMDASLEALVAAGKVSLGEAVARAVDPARLIAATKEATA
jgi:twitching motility protein PilT